MQSGLSPAIKQDLSNRLTVAWSENSRQRRVNTNGSCIHHQPSPKYRLLSMCSQFVHLHPVALCSSSTTSMRTRSPPQQLPVLYCSTCHVTSLDRSAELKRSSIMPDTGYGTVTFPARTWSDRPSSRPDLPIYHVTTL